MNQKELVAQTKRDLMVLNGFVSRSQLHAFLDCLSGEEKLFFSKKMAEIAQTISTMPKTYEQDGKGDQAVVYLHYFQGGMDWWITEKDKGDPDDEKPGQQLQAFGLVDLGYGAELGYISIVELIKNGIELDLYWTPKTLEEIKAKIAA